MSNQVYTIRNAKPDEFEGIGKLLVQVYSQLEGFPKESEQKLLQFHTRRSSYF